MEVLIIEIPKKTFTLYVKGLRTFIHVSKDREAELSKLKYGQTINLVNTETGETLRQTFWFLYSFKEVERFIFLVFKWDRKSAIFIARQRHARETLNTYSGIDKRRVFVSGNLQNRLIHQLEAFSSFMFITQDYMPSLVVFKQVVSGKEILSKEYVSVDKLGIKKDANVEESDCMYVWSLFPIDLLQ